MHCTTCHTKLDVIETRQTRPDAKEQYTVRRHKCSGCGAKYVTAQQFVDPKQVHWSQEPNTVKSVTMRNYPAEEQIVRNDVLVEIQDAMEAQFEQMRAQLSAAAEKHTAHLHVVAEDKVREIQVSSTVMLREEREKLPKPRVEIKDSIAPPAPLAGVKDISNKILARHRVEDLKALEQQLAFDYPDNGKDEFDEH